MKGALVALVVVAALAFSGCGETILDHGHITGKRYYPAHNDSMPFPIMVGQSCSRVGSSSVCSPIYTTIWYDVYVPDKWVLFLEQRNCNGDGTDCKTKRGRAYVTSADYAAYSAGQDWPGKNGDRHPDPPVRLKPA